MIRRRSLLAGLAATGAALAAPRILRAAAGDAAALPQGLLDAARDRAAAPYVAPAGILPPPFAGLSYDAFRAIRPIDGQSANVPVGGPFTADLLPPGLFFPDPVRIDLPDGDGWREKVFSPRLFDFGERYFAGVEVPETAPGAGFSGLRLRTPLNAPGVMDEFLVMQGASYFRAVPRGLAYGLSARSVALGSGDPGPEEFPAFVHLRLHPPADGAVRLEAVFDGPSLAGHLTMVAHPGDDTRLRIAVTLFPRVTLDRVGIAPLTSMYLKGPLRAAVSDDFRPRVHDTDVLAVQNGAGDVLWRPIANPAGIELSGFVDENPRGYGLYQTPRTFGDFEDGEALYHRRPSARVEPVGDWGAGSVVLVEIPTGDEFMDNIVAFWRPAAPLEAGRGHRFDYDLVWTGTPPPQAVPARIVQTRSGRQHEMPGTLRYVVDFEDVPDGAVADLSASVPGTLSGETLFPLPDGRMRASFLLTPGDARNVELRLALRDEAGRALSPVWLHRWTPARDGGV